MEWISVKNKKPPNDESVICYCPDGIFEGVMQIFYSDGTAVFKQVNNIYSANMYNIIVEYWAPITLPEQQQ